MDIRFADRRLTLTDVPLIFSILLNDYASHLVIDLSMSSLDLMEKYYFKYWHRIFSFRFRNDNILKMGSDEMARIEYDGAERLANQNAISLLSSFAPVVISCDIESSDLVCIIQQFEMLLVKKSNGGRFDNDLRMHMAEFVRKLSKLTLCDKKIPGTASQCRSCDPICARGCIVPKVIQNDADLANKWSDDLLRLSYQYPIGTVSVVNINAEVRIM